MPNIEYQTSIEPSVSIFVGWTTEACRFDHPIDILMALFYESELVRFSAILQGNYYPIRLIRKKLAPPILVIVEDVNVS